MLAIDIHILNHALPQRSDRLRAQGKLLSGMRLLTPRYLRPDASCVMATSTLAHGRADASTGASRGDLVHWRKLAP